MANILIGGSISTTGTSILGSANVVFVSDANHTLSVTEYTNNFLNVTSGVTLTATHNLIAPLVAGQTFTVQNLTTGGQAIQIIGPSGTGITISNGNIATVFCDGTNYVAPLPPPTTINFSPNGMAAPGVYTTEGTLTAALTNFKNLGFAVTVIFHGSYTFSGSYSYLGDSWIGAPESGGASITFSGSAQLTTPPTLIGGVIDILFTNTAPLCTVSTQTSLTIQDEASLISNVGFAASCFIQYSPSSGSVNLTIGGRALTTGFPFALFIITNAGKINVYAEDHAVVSYGTFGFSTLPNHFTITATESCNIDPSWFPYLVIGGLYVDRQGSGLANIVPFKQDSINGSNSDSLLYSSGTIYHSDGAAWSPVPAYAIQSVSVSNIPPLSGQVLYSTSPTAASWQTLSGLTPGGEAAGDLDGYYPNPTVVGIQTHPVSPIAPTAGQFLIENSAANESSWLSLSGDVSASISTPGTITVNKINGASVPAAGSLTAGNTLRVNGFTSLSYSALDLSGGSNYVLNALPITNIAHGTAAQVLVTNSGATAPAWVTISGDATISAAGAIANTTARGLTSATTVVSVSAATAPTTGQVLTATSSTAATWQTASTGITTLTGDVTASGSGSVAATVVALQNHPVNSTAPTDGYVLTWDGTDGYWLPKAIPGSTIFSGTGLVHVISGVEQPTATLVVNTDVSVTAAIAGTKISPAFGSQNISTTGTLSSGMATVTSIQDTGLSTGIVHSDSSGNFTSSAIALGSADVSGILAAINQASQSMSGDVIGTTAASTVTALWNFPINSVAPTDGYVLTWDGPDGYWKPELFSVSGAAGGDLSGTYPNPTVAAIQGNQIEPGLLSIGQDGYVLAWNNTDSQWQAQPITSGSITLSGDVSGAASSTHVNAIKSIPVNSTPPTVNQVLQYNGSQWTPTTPPASLPPSGAATGNLGGAYPSPTVEYIYNAPLSDLSSIGLAQDGYILTWVNSDGLLEMMPPPSGTFVAGGDLTGSNTNQIVSKIQDNDINLGVLGSSQDGYVLTWVNGDSLLEMMPAASGSFSAGGDLTGSNTSQTLSNIQGNVIDLGGLLGALQDGYVLTWNNTDGKLEMTTPGASIDLAGDVTGTSEDNYVGQRKTFLFMGA